MANNPNQEARPMTVEEAEKKVEIYRAYESLKTLPQWKLLMEEHFFKEERLRLSDLLVHPERALVENREEIENDLNAISRFKFHLQMVETIGSQTERQLEEFRAAQIEQQQELEAGDE